MTKQRLLIVVLLLLVLAALAGGTFAQGTDTDGDGLPNTADRCPNEAGPRENGGCPVRTNDPQAPDQDGDGVADFVDVCPDQPGTGFTNGCPTDPNVTPHAVPTTGFTLVPLVFIDFDGCLVGSQNPAPINVREQPNLNSQVLGFIEQGDQLEGIGATEDNNNVIWYHVKGYDDAHPEWEGWINSEVGGIVTNGNCRAVGFPWLNPNVCMVAVSYFGPSPIEVHTEPTVNSPIAGTFWAGFQFEPLFHDYDENNDSWIAGYVPQLADYIVWVRYDDVILTPDCVYLPMVIHADAPDNDPIVVEFDPNLIPEDWNPFGDDGSNRPQIDRGGVIEIDTDLFFPHLPEITPEPQATPWRPEIPDGDPWVQFILDQLFADPPSEASLPTENPIRFLSGGEELPTIKRAVLHVRKQGSEQHDYFIILPEFGFSDGQCPPRQFVASLVNAFGVPFVGDPTGMNIAGLDPDEAALIGLLLPAVQKVREAAAHGSAAHGTGSGAGTGKVSLQDFHFVMGDGSVVPADGSNAGAPAFMNDGNLNCGIIAVVPVYVDGALQGYQQFGLLLPAV